MEELKVIQEKHKNVSISYDNVIENMKSICKLDTKRDETLINNHSISNYLNLNESKIDPVSNHSFIQNTITEEDVYKAYSEFLEATKKAFDENFLHKSEDDFIQLMRQKGYSSVQPTNSGERSNKRKNSSALDKDKFSKGKSAKTKNNYDDEYSIKDNDLIREDEVFKIERDHMIKEFKEAV